ncbi:cytochrome P450 [Kocuria sp.]|uniref:cytochrome P450 n=1 Tax=Kocuria sp. TaxID=1871328 RepID=UPI0026DC6CCB|nr:cytochrome P450 [Kocuria sp.]MDO4920183.1 cytochrome P450 [Kocuria sp.]
MVDQSDVRRSRKPGEAVEPRVEHTGSVWRIRGLTAARQVLQARHATTQAGFTAEKIPTGFFRHHPILVSDGPLHDEQRKKVARFFAPAVVARRHVPGIESRAVSFVDAAAASGDTCLLDELALRFSVDVTREIVGINHSSLDGMCRRLVSFFNQPPLDITKPDYGRTRAQWARAAFNGLVPIIRFYLADVRPAIRALRRNPADDVVSHLLAEGYSTADILVECMTYGTAGMVTTREFIVMAAWHLLEDDRLRARYLVAGEKERFAVLHEILRLEPVVGHLYRRVQEPVEVSDGGSTWTIPAGDLVDVCVRQTNTDPQEVGEHPTGLCPGRSMPPGVDATGMSFSDGAHKCPGRPLAITETDRFLLRLLSHDPVLVQAPTLERDNLIEGYTLRGLGLRFPTPGTTPDSTSGTPSGALSDPATRRATGAAS